MEYKFDLISSKIKSRRIISCCRKFSNKKMEMQQNRQVLQSFKCKSLIFSFSTAFALTASPMKRFLIYHFIIWPEKIFWAEAWDAKNIRSTLKIYNATNIRQYISNAVHSI